MKIENLQQTVDILVDQNNKIMGEIIYSTASFYYLLCTDVRAVVGANTGRLRLTGAYADKNYSFSSFFWWILCAMV